MHADVVIIGGSVVGSSVAWHLRQDGFRGHIVVIERDPTYARASASLAMGGIRQQFCTAVTVQMVQYSLDLWRNFAARLSTPECAIADARFTPRGYLFLADEARAAALTARYEAQLRAGAHVRLLDRDAVHRLVPDAALDDIVFAMFGPDDGYASPRAVLKGFRAAAAVLDVEFRQAEVVGMDVSDSVVRGVRLSDGSTIETPTVVNATGAWSGRLAQLAGLDVPVRPMRQMLFRASLPRLWPYRFPMVIDPGGVHWRHEDPLTTYDPDRIIVAFTRWDEETAENFVSSDERWSDEFLPALVRRMPAFADLRSAEGWAGLYEMTPDHNPVLGEHPDLRGLIFASGFSGHGLMMSPATGKIVSELIRTGQSQTFDISLFAPDRFARGALVHDAATI